MANKWEWAKHSKKAQEQQDPALGLLFSPLSHRTALLQVEWRLCLPSEHQMSGIIELTLATELKFLY